MMNDELVKLQPFKRLIYISGPISRGDLGVNVRNAVCAANNLITLGFAPYIPHLQSVFWALLDPPTGAEMVDSYGVWLRLDYAVILRSDAVLRIPGESKGGDAEVEFAHTHMVPVFGSIPDMVRFFAKNDMPPAFIRTPRAPTLTIAEVLK